MLSLSPTDAPITQKKFENNIHYAQCDWSGEDGRKMPQCKYRIEYKGGYAHGVTWCPDGSCMLSVLHAESKKNDPAEGDACVCVVLIVFLCGRWMFVSVSVSV